jgi:endonuclease/exonuclease/phosphatase family metal-dependent hydrolase
MSTSRLPAGPLLAIALLGLGAASCRTAPPAPPAPAAPAPETSLRVLSYNIHAGKDAQGVDNLARVAQVIGGAGADLVLLQEVDRRTTRSGNVDQLQALMEATGLVGAFGRTLDYQGGEYGIAILSRWPIRSHRMIPLPVEPPQERAGGSHEPRGALHAVVDSPTGDIHVVGTHLDASGEDGYRWQEMGRLLALADSLRSLGFRVLLGGDLNAVPGTRILEEPHAHGWRDGWEECGAGTGSTYPADQPVRRIDYLLLGEGMGCRQAEVLATRASDHRPVAMTVTLEGTPAARAGGVAGGERESAAVPAPAASPQAVPGTDIWLFPLEPLAVRVGVEGAIRVTRRPGYDNQPSFLPGSDGLLYTVIDETGQADIWRFDLRSRRARPLTRTAPESEYSATVLPSGERFSVIRVEADSTQRLWSFDLSGGDPRVILPEVRPVGYHAWLTGGRLGLFILGDPPTLQVASAREGAAREVARDIGRCLQRIPGPGTLSFVQRAGPGAGWIAEYDPGSGEIRPLAPLLEGNEFYAWTPEGVLVMGQGSRLFRRLLGLSRGWDELAELGPAGLAGISRVAVSPDGRWIAVVAEERTE